MSFALTLNGQVLHCENSDATQPDYDFPLNSTSILFDEPAQAIEFATDKHRLYIALADIATPVLANYAALKAQIIVWQMAATAVSGKNAIKRDSFTTAAGATAYAVNDVINAAGAASLRSINVGANSGYIVGLTVEMDNASPLLLPSPLPTLRVRFFESSDASLMIADNAADDVLFANNTRRIGHIDLPIMVSEGGRLVTSTEDLRFMFGNLTNNLLYYKIINTVGTPTLGTAGVGRGVVLRAKVDQN